MTDTTTRPLPTTIAELREHYLPLEPETGVSRSLTAIARIDKAIAEIRELLTQRDERDHQLVSELVGAALTGDPLEPVVVRMVPADRPLLEHRLSELQTARSLAAHRHTRAQYDDPGYLAWKQACDRVSQEWQQALASPDVDDTDQARFQRLVDFATTH